MVDNELYEKLVKQNYKLPAHSKIIKTDGCFTGHHRVKSADQILFPNYSIDRSETSHSSKGSRCAYQSFLGEFALGSAPNNSNSIIQIDRIDTLGSKEIFSAQLPQTQIKLEDDHSFAEDHDDEFEEKDIHERLQQGIAQKIRNLTETMDKRTNAPKE